MEKLQAQNLIKEVLQSKFNKELFVNFIRNLCKDYEEKNQYNSGSIIPDAFKEHISAFERIGKYTDNNNEVLDIFIVQTKTVSKLERTRTALRNFIVWNLKKSEKQYGLVAFYSKEDDGADWRLSLIKIDYESYRDDKNKIKISEELVPAKRFSYLVGESEHSYTAQNQLFPLLVNNEKPNIAKTKEHDNSLESAFSIEKVTNEFYEQYKGLYLRMTENLVLIESLQKEEIDIVRFVKKTLGQIVFLYFLQKKGWLGVAKNDKMGNGSKRFLQDRFESIAETNKNYFNDFLRYLFYEALAKQHNDDGIKDYIKKLDCKIPFLNGGLFEADYQNWQHVNILIPNEIFRNNEINKAGDKGTGILDVFDRYNFTIKEDEPLEKEVAIDPEMLGKVFEQMLEVKERKSKGAFYTPREIVHYMCQESLINYIHSEITESNNPTYQSIDTQQTNLFGGETDKKGNLKLELQHRNKTEIKLEDIEKFIRNGHLYLENEIRVTTYGSETPTYKYEIAESIRTNAQRIDNLLKDIKICDPAVGSGAFVVGMLNEIINARTLLNVYLKNKTHTAYYLKRHAIKESIYGADIDISAIDIARLRLWLSMIVDEEDYDSIEPLPNLDYKIVRGNSLVSKLGDDVIDIDWDIIGIQTDMFGSSNVLKISELLKRISSKQKEYFDSDNEKKQLSNEIRNLKIDLLINQLSFMLEKTKGIEKEYGTGKLLTKQTEKLLTIKSWEQHINKLRKLKENPKLPLDFFDWKLDFPEIMNPLLFGLNSKEVETANSQIVALNKQIDAINIHLKNSNIETLLIHLQANIAQSQITVIKQQLSEIESKIQSIYGRITNIEKNVVKEADISFVYNIQSINISIKEINQRINKINPQLQNQNPNIGFDIVIGNPPYGFRTVLSKEEKEYFRKVRKIEFSSGDSAELFVKIAFDNLTKANGVLTFIIPKKSLYGDAWEDTRINYWKKYNLVFVLDAGKSFDNVLLEASVFGLKKEVPNNQVKIGFLGKDGVKEVGKFFINELFAESNTLQVYKAQYSKSIIEKIEKIKFKKKVVEGNLGLAIGTDFFSDIPTDYKLLKGIDIQRYQVRSNRYLKNKQDIKWENAKEFLKPKVLVQRLVAHIENPYPHLKITACYDEDGIIISNTLMSFKIDNKIEEKFLLAYLNSKFTSWYAYNFIYARAIRGMDFYNFYIQQLPIPNISKEKQMIFVSIVDKIISKITEGIDTSSLEQEIDNMVYKIYELTYEEVKVIDPDFWLSENEYNNYKTE